MSCCCLGGSGIARNKVLAKRVGGFKKPFDQTTLLPRDVSAFLQPCVLGTLMGIGFATVAKLKVAGYV